MSPRPPDPDAPSPRIKVLGIGNVLMRDDGVGPHVVRVLEAGWSVPAEVAVEDLGTPGLDLVPHLKGVEALVVVDAARVEEPPGTIRTWREDALRGRPLGLRLGPHDPGLEATLATLDFAGDGPRSVLLVGVVPGRVEDGPGLTADVRSVVPAAVAAILAELERLGAPARARTHPAPPDLWWEREPGPSSP